MRSIFVRPAVRQLPNTGMLFEFRIGDNTVAFDIYSPRQFLEIARTRMNHELLNASFVRMKYDTDVMILGTGYGTPDAPPPAEYKQYVKHKDGVEVLSADLLFVVYPDEPLACPISCGFCFARGEHKVRPANRLIKFSEDSVIKTVNNIIELVRSYISRLVSHEDGKYLLPVSTHVGIGGSIDPTLIDYESIEALYRELVSRVKEEKLKANIVIALSTSNPNNDEVDRFLEFVRGLTHRLKINTDIGITFHDELLYKHVNYLGKPSFETYLSERINVVSRYGKALLNITTATPMFPLAMFIIHGDIGKTINTYVRVIRDSDVVGVVLLGAHPPLSIPDRTLVAKAVAYLAEASFDPVEMEYRQLYYLDGCLTKKLFNIDTTIFERNLLYICRRGRCQTARICPRGSPTCIY